MNVNIFHFQNIHLAYGASYGYALEARGIYGEYFPGRRLPNSRTFTPVDRRTRETGCVKPEVHDRGLELLGLMKK